MFSYKRTKLLSIIERKIRRRAKKCGGRGENRCATPRDASLAPRRPWKSRRNERRESQYGGWRGRARDKMATNEKLAEENHGDRYRRRARARTPADSHVDRIPRVHASRLDKSTLKSQTAANSRGKFAYHFHQTTTTAIRISRRRNVPYLSKTFAISWNRPPRHITRISRAIFPKRVPYMRETENRARLSNTEPTHLIRKI